MNLKSKIVSKIISGATSIALLSVSLIPASFAVASPVDAAAGLSLTTVVNKELAEVGEELSYTLTVKNTGTEDLNNVIVWTAPLNLATYVNGSGTVTRSWNTTTPLRDDFVTAGGSFGTIPVGGTITIKFKTKITNSAKVDDNIWLVAGAKSDKVSTVESKAFTRILAKKIVSLCAEKTADKEVYKPGDIVKYTVKICNKGNIRIHNVQFNDRLAPEITLVKGTTSYTRGDFSTSVNDNWPTAGVNLGELNPGREAFFRYSVKINEDVKDGTVIVNAARLKYDERPIWIRCEARIKVVREDKERGSLKIFKFEDTNGNAVYNEGERALPGFKFRITGNGVDKTVSTESDGVVIVTDLEPGTYTITETVPAGWRITTDNNIKVTVKADELTEVRFGNKQVGKVLSKVKKLPDTGPGLILALLGASIPAGAFIKRLKKKI